MNPIKIAIIVLLLLVISATYPDTKPTKNAEFLAWVEQVTWESPDAYIIPNNAIISFFRHKYIRAYNDIIQGGQMYYPKRIKEAYGVDYLQQIALCRIVETTPKSEIVRVQYIEPYTKFIKKGFISRNELVLAKDYKSRFVK